MSSGVMTVASQVPTMSTAALLPLPPPLVPVFPPGLGR